MGQASGPTERYGPQSRVRIVQAKAIILKNEAIPGCIRHNRWRALPLQSASHDRLCYGRQTHPDISRVPRDDTTLPSAMLGP